MSLKERAGIVCRNGVALYLSSLCPLVRPAAATVLNPIHPDKGCSVEEGAGMASAPEKWI